MNDGDRLSDRSRYGGRRAGVTLADGLAARTSLYCVPLATSPLVKVALTGRRGNGSVTRP